MDPRGRAAARRVAAGDGHVAPLRWKVHPAEQMRARFLRPESLVLAAACLVGALFQVLLPPWTGEDEPWHLEYAHHISRGHPPWGGKPLRAEDAKRLTISQLLVRERLAGLSEEEIVRVQAEIVASMRDAELFERIDWISWMGGARGFEEIQTAFTATRQPPLYYVLGGVWLAALGIENVEHELIALRLLSLPAYLAVVALTGALARLALRERRAVIGAMLVAALWPIHARQAAVVNNDVLAKLLAAAVLYAGARFLVGQGTRRTAAGLVVLGALGLFTKTTTVAPLLVAMGALLWSRGGRAGRRTLVAASALSIAVLAGGVLFWLALGSPVIPRHLGDLQGRLHAAMSEQLRKVLFETSIGQFGYYSRRFPDAVYPTAGIGLALAGLGLLFAWLRRGDVLVRRVLTYLAVAVVAQLVLIAMRGIGHGRYLLPLLPALAIFLAAGVVTAVPARRRNTALAVLAGALLLFDVVFVWYGLIRYEYFVVAS